jgi:hypothetical protein
LDTPINRSTKACSASSAISCTAMVTKLLNDRVMMANMAASAPNAVAATASPETTASVISPREAASSGPAAVAPIASAMATIVLRRLTFQAMERSRQVPESMSFITRLPPSRPFPVPRR